MLNFCALRGVRIYQCISSHSKSKPFLCAGLFFHFVFQIEKKAHNNNNNLLLLFECGFRKRQVRILFMDIRLRSHIYSSLSRFFLLAIISIPKIMKYWNQGILRVAKFGILFCANTPDNFL